MFGLFSRKRKPKTNTAHHSVATFCPSCDNELLTNGEVLHDGNIVIQRCHECNTISNWYFGAPVPILLARPIDATTGLKAHP